MNGKQLIIGSIIAALAAGPAFSKPPNMKPGAADNSGQSAELHSSFHPGPTTNRAIKTVQHKLKFRGYGVKRIDGLWGRNSIDALIQFQKSKGLKATGTMTKKTANKLGLSHSEFAVFEIEVKERPAWSHGTNS